MIELYVLTGIVIILVILLYKSESHSIKIEQYIGNVPVIKPIEEIIVLTADQNMDSDRLYLTSKTFNGAKKNVGNEAHEYFKKQFGLSDKFINGKLSKYVINDRANCQVEYMSSRPNNKFKVIDGGYKIQIPKGMKLHGRYGGKKGVASDLPGVLAYGYYMFGNYKIKYYGLCPLTTLKTYDGNYTFVDCEVEIVQGHHVNSQRPNMKGKAQGVYIDKKVSNGSNHVVIRNVLTF